MTEKETFVHDAQTREHADTLSSICDAVRAPTGGQLLDLMASVHSGLHEEERLREKAGEGIIETARNLGLLRRCNGQVVFTSQGYLVGNVAKEYTHWIENGRHMPPPCPPDEFIEGNDVLDVGCSFGRWLWDFQKKSKSVCGLEMQKEYIGLGRALAERENIPAPKILHGSAEELSTYVPENSMDFVFIRLVLNYVFITKTLKQVSRVVRSGGIVWVQTYPWAEQFHQFCRGGRRRQFRNTAFAVFGLLNSLVFETTRRQLSIRSQGRMHSVHKPVFPTRRTWKSVCSKLGFHEFRDVRRDVFWVRKT